MAHNASAAAPAPAGGESAWRRLTAWLRAAEAALSTTQDDIQDHRILALEAEVARLSRAVRQIAGDVAET